MHCSAEFMIEPWEPGNLDRVDAAVMALAGYGVEVDIGAFANIAEGDSETVLPALVHMLNEMLESGATTITIQIRRAGALPRTSIL